MNDANFHQRAVAAEMLFDGLRMSVHVDENLCDFRGGTEFEPEIEQRASADWHQTFGNGVGDGAKARTVASG
jgi:hypothetical protein